MMKVYISLLVLAFAAYCQAADIAKLNEVCASGDKCTVKESKCEIPKGCTKGLCLCKGGYKYKSQTECVKSKKVGDKCASTEECPGSASCTSGNCDCGSGTANSDKTGCLTQYVGKTCTAANVATECGGTMDCTGGKCACKSNYKEDNKQCRTAYLGESCDGKTCGVGTCDSSKICACTNSLVAYLKTNCIHKDAKTKLGKGDECTQSTASSAKWCKEDLNCNTCPEGGSKRVCMSGAESVKAGFSIIILAALVAFFKQ